jgi:hypothetical protein
VHVCLQVGELERRIALESLQKDVDEETATEADQQSHDRYATIGTEREIKKNQDGQKLKKHKPKCRKYQIFLGTKILFVHGFRKEKHFLLIQSNICTKLWILL